MSAAQELRFYEQALIDCTCDRGANDCTCEQDALDAAESDAIDRADSIRKGEF